MAALLPVILQGIERMLPKKAAPAPSGKISWVGTPRCGVR